MVLDIGHGICMSDEIEKLKEENERLLDLVVKLGDMLSATVNVLKGEPPEDKQHSTHDIVEAAKALQQRLQGAEWALEAEQEYTDRLKADLNTALREVAIDQREACAAILDGPDEVSANEVRKVKLVTDEPFDWDKPLPVCWNCGRVMLVGKCCGKPDYT
jgi:hypothetical protein